MKDRAVTGDSTTRAILATRQTFPRGSAITDARIYITPFVRHRFSADRGKSSSVFAQTVFTGAATSFASMMTVAPGRDSWPLQRAGPGIRFTCRMTNAPIIGWIQGGQNLVTTDPSAAQLQVTGASGSGLTIQPGPFIEYKSLSWNQTFGNCTPPAKDLERTAICEPGQPERLQPILLAAELLL